jgi:SAM-dependent methyltransferase
MSLDTQRIQTNVEELRVSWAAGPYYENAEQYMDRQWRDMIYPNIKDRDFTCVLELAPGHGRNTEKLRAFAKEIHLVDINEPCIEACRNRFAGAEGPCKLHFHVNDGVSLGMIADGTISFIYSWDAAVYVDRLILRGYIHEFARILKPGGSGFVHHSNYGAIAPNPDSNWRDNPAWRSTMSAKLFADYCQEAGLVLEDQKLLLWNSIEGLDCISVFRKPDA